MKPRNLMLSVLGLLAGSGLLYGTWAAVRAHRDLVTLNVRNMDVRQVVKKIEWQTWETIVVHSNVHGKVTLHVRKLPLEEALRIIGEQTDSGWSKIYPLYSKGRSLANLKRALRGEIDPAIGGWTNLQGRMFFRSGPGGIRGGGPWPGGFGENPQPLVSLQIENKDLSFVSLALNRFAQARVVPEDGTAATVTLNLMQAPVPRAVAQLAKQAHRSWTKLYALRGQAGPGGPGGPPQFAMRNLDNAAGLGSPGGPSALATRDAMSPDRRRPDATDLTPDQREEFRKQRDALEEELKQVLPTAERQKWEQAQQEREQQMQQMQSLTPEQRQQRFAQLGGGGMDRRNLERLKNSTPEQRAEQYRRMREMRSRFEQRQQQPPQPPPPR